MTSNKPNLNQQFGSRIRKLRLERGLSQEDLGASSNLDRTYLSSIERGHRHVSLNNIASLALALEVSLNELFIGIELIDEKYS